MKIKKMLAGLIAAVMFITSDGSVLNMVHEFAEGIEHNNSYYGEVLQYHYNDRDTEKYREYYVPYDIFNDYQYGYSERELEIPKKYYFDHYTKMYHEIDDSMSEDELISNDYEIVEETEVIYYKAYRFHVEIIGVNIVNSSASNLFIPAYIDDLPVTDFKYIDVNNYYSVSVEEGNDYLCCENGVLYNINKTKLILFTEIACRDNFILPDSVLEIGDYAFYNDYLEYQIRNILPESEENENRSYGPNIYLNSKLRKIGACAFKGHFEIVSLPMNVKEIGENAFYDCNNFFILNSDCIVDRPEYFLKENNHSRIYIPYKRSLWNKLEKAGYCVLKYELKDSILNTDEIPINSILFPDPVFRKYILQTFDYDKSNTLSYDDVVKQIVCGRVSHIKCG